MLRNLWGWTKKKKKPPHFLNISDKETISGEFWNFAKVIQVLV